jgi:hypothetical protein
MATVTCRTDGCGNEGIGLDVATTWTDEEGTEHAVATVVCGVCGQEITDVSEEGTSDDPA